MSQVVVKHMTSAAEHRNCNHNTVTAYILHTTTTNLLTNFTTTKAPNCKNVCIITSKASKHVEILKHLIRFKTYNAKLTDRLIFLF